MEQVREQPRQEHRQKMSYAEFFAAAESAHAEWVDGEAIFFMPAGALHQRLIKFLLLLLDQYISHFRLGEVFQAPFLMKLSPGGNAREPDILFVAAEHKERITATGVAGPADLVVEVVSPESAARDRTEKFYEYQLAGVREYWLIDPRPGFERADFWALDGSGRYQPIPFDQGHIIRSTVLRDFWLDTKWLWADPLPDAVYTFELLEKIREQTRLEHRQRMSYTGYLAAAQSAHAEWVDGEATFFAPHSTAHQSTVGFLLVLLRQFVRRFRSGKVLLAPYEMRLPNGNARGPDILVVTTEHLDRLTDERLVGPADVVFEIISDESIARDRGEKFYEYQAAGVREYWIVDPRPGLERIDLWALDSSGRYQPITADSAGAYRSTVLPGFRLDARWLPNVNELDERDLIDEMTRGG